MRITADLISKSAAYLNPLGEYHLDLRGYKIPFLENLTATNDQFGCIDLTDNEIVTVEPIPQLLRLKTLMLINNRITRLEDRFADMCPHLESLVLTNNKIGRFEEIDKISATCKQLVRLCLFGNVVSQLPNYRQYVIFKLPHLRVLDFQKISDAERKEAKKFFESAAGTAVLKELSQREDGVQKKKAEKRTSEADDEQVIRKIAELEKQIEQAESLEEVQALQKQIETLTEA